MVFLWKIKKLCAITDTRRDVICDFIFFTGKEADEYGKEKY